MNEELQNALAEILNKTVDGVAAGVDFLQGEMPEVVRQLLAWKLAASIAGACIALALFRACVGVWRKVFAIRPEPMSNVRTWAWRSFGGNDRDVWLEGGGTCALVVSAFFGVIFFVVTIVDSSTALQIWLAPKVYLIEYAANLAK